MSIANLCRQEETSPYNVYQFSGKLCDEYNDITFDTAGNVTSYINDCLGSSYQTTEQKYTYDALYQLVKVEGECKYSFQKNNNIDRTDTYTQTFQYDTTGNLIRKTTNLSDVSRLAWSDLANRDLSYEYNIDYAHRLKKAGSDYYQYDSNGNITAISTTSFDPEYDIQITYIGDDEIHYNWSIDGTPPIKKRNPSNQRTCFYDDRNQMSEVMDIGVVSHAYYHYDEEKIRTSKNIGYKSEIITFNDFYSISLDSRTRSELGQTQKSIMLGNTRLVSKIDSGARSSTRQWKDEHTFYYLQDHIGTANFITTYEGEIFQITEYTPYGERWIERSKTKSYAYYLPYRFIGKPLDEETGWYYFGARYYDPKYQIWTTSDPALIDYFNDTQKGEGGVFNHINLNTYHYAGNNPIKYTDPTGNFDMNIFVQRMSEDYCSNRENFDANAYKRELFEGYTGEFIQYMREEGLYEMGKAALRLVADNSGYVAILCYAIPGGQTAGAVISWTGTGADWLLNVIEDVENGKSLGKSIGTQLIKSGANYAIGKVTGEIGGKLLKDSNLTREAIDSINEAMSNLSVDATDKYTDKAIDKVADIFDGV